MATTSMTNALFSAMDRRGDGVITRDEFNEMAFTAIHDNPLVSPARRGLLPAQGAAHVAAPGPSVPGLAGRGTALPTPAPAAPAVLAPAVTFGGMTFSVPPVGAPPVAPPRLASPPWAPPPAAAPGAAQGAAAPQAAPPPRAALVPPSLWALPASPTESAFLAAPSVPGVTSTAPTASMTSALFTAMDRRGDGILTRDEWSQMAVTAVHNNALVRPSKSLSASTASGPSAVTGKRAPSLGPAATSAQPLGAVPSPCSHGSIARALSSSGPGLSPAPSQPAVQSFGAATASDTQSAHYFVMPPGGVLAPPGQGYAAWC
mmetsp:Transcript_109731/g.338708  ORF Transcript_109731/g.338708 Transcript_109731/m.338708 type:complete len:317 (+) Transcript_109731:78-1028(+)